MDGVISYRFYEPHFGLLKPDLLNEKKDSRLLQIDSVSYLYVASNNF